MGKEAEKSKFQRVIRNSRIQRSFPTFLSRDITRQIVLELDYLFVQFVEFGPFKGHVGNEPLDVKYKSDDGIILHRI